MKIKMKRVDWALPEYAIAETVVFWDMDNCPLPNGFDPCLLAPRIETELEDLGYSGPLTIVAGGNLSGIPYEFLRALSSTGVLIKNSICGLSDMVYEFLDSRTTNHSPMSIMLITTNSLLLNTVVCQMYMGLYVGYNLLLAYPPVYEIKDPHHSSFVYVGGEWLWTRYSLLKVSELEETRGLVDIGGFQKFSCEPCNVDSFGSFEDFIEHCETSRLHKALVEFTDDSVEMMIERDVENLEFVKQSKEYIDLLEWKKEYFEEIYNDLYKWKEEKTEEEEKAEKAKAAEKAKVAAEKEKAASEKAKAKAVAENEKTMAAENEKTMAMAAENEKEKAKTMAAENDKANNLVIGVASSLLRDDFFYEPWMTKADNLVIGGESSLPADNFIYEPGMTSMIKANNLEIGDEGGESSLAVMNLKEFEEDCSEEKNKKMMVVRKRLRELRKNLMEQMM